MYCPTFTTRTLVEQADWKLLGVVPLSTEITEPPVFTAPVPVPSVRDETTLYQLGTITPIDATVKLTDGTITRLKNNPMITVVKLE